jgi:hypothetical protein
MFRKDKAGRHKGRQSDRKANLDSAGLCGFRKAKLHNKGNNEEISWFEELNVLSLKQAGARPGLWIHIDLMRIQI